MWPKLYAVLAALAWPQLALANCSPIAFDGVPFTICSYPTKNVDLRLFHRGSNGNAFGSFRAIDRILNADGKALIFAMNAGMFHDDLSAVGLYIEEAQQSAPLVKRAGPGNFGLLPNGVFCIGKNGTATVIETLTYAKDTPSCRFATQSGPMLVIDGKLHPRFIPDSDSVNIRNGVGVSADGALVHFAISDARVNFHHFGRLFRDMLDTPNALYLDGKVSRLHAPDLRRSDPGFPMGPIVGIVDTAP
ncbi:phosphodiester glycosidase family protein [Actibacterium sp. 188UL27-1]|uniref:phosphodiester glycosidase family protein n=1 Tax=Actibacterium sp. 188UL27-1 TaxID=2786961 RepID=UPI00351BF3FB